MPVSILTIDVQDDAFKKFQAEFARYQAALAQMPGMWGKVGQAANAATTTAANAAAAARVNPWVQPQPAGAARAARPGAGTGGVYGTIRGFVRSVATAVGAGAAGGAGGPPGPPAPPGPPGAPPGPAGGPGPTRRVLLDMERFGRAASSVQREMRETAKHTLAISKHIEATTYDLVRWAGLALLAGGLLGGGGLFGLSRLASEVGAARRSAQGFGITTAEHRALGINYSRAFDTDSVLGNIAHAKSTAADRWVFGSMGVDERKNPADLAIDTAIAAKKIFEQGGQSMDYAKARGLDKLYGEDDLRRLHALSMVELEDMRKRYQSDLKQLKISDNVQVRWQNLGVQLTRAGETIWTVLVTKLAPLAAPLEHLSAAFVKFIQNLADSGKLKEWVDSLASGIEWLGTYLTSDKFAGDMSRFGTSVGAFITDIEAFASAVWHIVKRFNSWLGTSSTDGIPQLGLGGDPAHPYDEWQRLHKGDTSQPAELQAMSAMPRSQRKLTIDPETGVPYPDELEKYYRLPKGLLNNVWGAESDYGRNLSTSAAGAKGHFQFMDATAQRFGVENPNDYKQSAFGAAHYLDILTKQFGDTSKAVAAYNWGEGNLQKDIDAHGDKWRDFLPKETSDYVNKVMGNLKVTSTINVQVTNSTGSDVSVTSGAAAVQR